MVNSMSCNLALAGRGRMPFDQLKRRDFITLLGGAAVAWPLAARAQQPAMPVVGFLDGQSFDLHLMTAFRQALKDAGYIEGRNVAIYFRSADGQTDRLVTLAGDIIGRRVAVIVTTGGGAAALAAYAATTTIPIVFVNGVDPVSSGLVVSLNRPGGNATGVYIFQQVLEGKRLGLLRELVPSAASIAVLLNPTNANFQTQLRGVQDAARDLGQQVSILSANTEREIDVAFATVAQSGARALLVGSDPFFSSERDQVIALAARYAIPAIYEGREFATAGGLASYGTSLADAYRQAALYAGRILKGEKPADLPIVQPTKFEFVINMKTAKTLGLDVSPGLAASADEIVE
jgi:putative tryptophan/tyrosine transport system substrate-binding protein